MTRRIVYASILGISMIFWFSASAFEQKAANDITVVGYVMDTMCQSSHSNEDAKTHPNACALLDACKRSGYALVSNDKVYTLDQSGNKLAIAALEAQKHRHGLRVTIAGTLDGQTLHVAKLEYTPLDK